MKMKKDKGIEIKLSERDDAFCLYTKPDGRFAMLKEYGIKAVRMRRRKAISLSPVGFRSKTNIGYMTVPISEVIGVARMILEVAGINAAIVENPRLVTVENCNEEFSAFSNVPGMKCTHYRFDSISPEYEDLEDKYADDVEHLQEMEDVKVFDQITYEDECEEEEEN